ncbi:peptide chain release factor N(5)-glutamine methyltransferase [bacterium]|nr:peptide chain release factor N(5)-glutamine methyltransferase [bacterium]
MVSPPLIIKDAIARSAQWLGERGIESPRLDAEVLLGHIVGMSRLDLYLAWDRPLSEDEKVRYRQDLKRRADHEPVAYIIGHREFYSIDFEVNRHVLIPRPETELLVDTVLEAIETLQESRPEKMLRLADVGTGSGSIAVALAHTLPEIEIVATDTSRAALDTACRNAERNEVADCIDFRLASILEGVEGPLEIVASNPPYIPESDRDTLPPDVVKHEPTGALFSGPDGLEAIRELIPQAAERLVSGGFLIFEIGQGQGDAVRDLIRGDGCYEEPEVRPDYQGIERVVVARRL